LRLSSSNTLDGNITSPAKAGGINNIEFYWRAQASYGAITFYVQTSPDGENWTTIEEVLTPNTNETEYHHYEKAVQDRDARYFRIQTDKKTYNSYYIRYLFVDSIALDAMPYVRQVGRTDNLAQSTRVIPVEVAGFLNGNAKLALVPGSAFSLTKTILTPEEINGGKTASFDLTVTATQSGEYEGFISVSNTKDLGEEPFIIPVFVKYTQPYIALAEEIAPVTTTSVPVTIPVKVKGVLNSDATISLIQPDSERPAPDLSLSKASITPGELAGDAVVTFDVIFSAEAGGWYPVLIEIANGDIQPLYLYFEIRYIGVGINNVSPDAVSVSMSNGILHVAGAPAGTNVTVLNVSGQPVFTSTIQSADEQYNVSLASGVYLVKVGNKTWKVLR
jgi:hypothetical protein